MQEKSTFKSALSDREKPKLSAMRTLSLTVMLLNALVSFGLVTCTKVASIYSHRLSNLQLRSFRSNNVSPLSSVEDTTIIPQDSSNSVVGRIRNACRVVYKFSRPHTIKVCLIGSAVIVCSA